MATEQPKDDKPKIIIDDDWKQEAQSEKERLAKEQAKADEAVTTDQALPKPDFPTLISSFLTQVLIALGAIEHPSMEGKINLELAKFNIGMLEVIEEKTKGNLTEREQKLFEHILHQVRMAYVEVASRHKEGEKKPD